MPCTFIFDTETTGLPITAGFGKYYPSSDFEKYDKCRVVEVAWIKVNDKDEIVSQGVRIIKPHGEYTTDETSRFHGITTAIAEEKGIHRQVVLAELHKELADVDTIVGHNVAFDIAVLGSEFLRISWANPFLKKDVKCTMALGQKAMKQSKAPKLMELYTHLFGTGFENAHSALADVTATWKCYQSLREEDVAKTRAYIQNVSRRVQKKITLFRMMRDVNESPYMYHEFFCTGVLFLEFELRTNKTLTDKEKEWITQFLAIWNVSVVDRLDGCANIRYLLDRGDVEALVDRFLDMMVG